MTNWSWEGSKTQNGDEAIKEKTKIPSMISVILNHPAGLVKKPRLKVGLAVVDDAAAAAASMELITNFVFYSTICYRWKWSLCLVAFNNLGYSIAVNDKKTTWRTDSAKPSTPISFSRQCTEGNVFDEHIFVTWNIGICLYYYTGSFLSSSFF